MSVPAIMCGFAKEERGLVLGCCKPVIYLVSLNNTNNNAHIGQGCSEVVAKQAARTVTGLFSRLC